MSDESAGRYLSRIARTLSSGDIKVEIISTGILATDINNFIEKHNFHLIVRAEGSSGLSRWSAESLAGIRAIPMNNI